MHGQTMTWEDLHRSGYGEEDVCVYNYSLPEKADESALIDGTS